MYPSTVNVNVILANNKVSTIAQHYQQLQQTRRPLRSGLARKPIQTKTANKDGKAFSRSCKYVDMPDNLTTAKDKKRSFMRACFFLTVLS